MAAANGHSFAFGRAFGKRRAWNCSRLKILKLKIYFVAHPMFGQPDI
jgi:hypothetical protein